MKVNHDATKSIIYDIAGLLREQARRAMAYEKETQEIAQNPAYAESYKTKEIEKKRVAYIATHNDTQTQVAELIERMAEEEKKQEEILELDIPEYANTVASIQAAKGDLPAIAIDAIKKNFAGHYQALLIIKKLFSIYNYGIDLRVHGYEEYTQSAEHATMPLIKAAQNLELSGSAAPFSMYKLFRDVIRFGEVRGIKFSENEKAFVDGIEEDNLKEMQTRKAMGLE